MKIKEVFLNTHSTTTQHRPRVLRLLPVHQKSHKAVFAYRPSGPLYCKRPAAEWHRRNPQKIRIQHWLAPAVFLPLDGQICIAAEAQKKSVHRIHTNVGDVGDGIPKVPGFAAGDACSPAMHGGSQSGDGPHPPAVGSAHHNSQKVTGRLPKPQSCPHSML